MSEFDNLPKKNPLLSVIIPVYNVEKYLPEALDSVRKQSFQNIEIIAINDGSTDSSKNILDHYQSMDDRIQVFYQANAGLAAARNKGLKEARGEIIYFFDSDDVLAEGIIEKVVDRMQMTNSQLVFFGLSHIDKNGNKVSRIGSKRRPNLNKPISGKVFLKMLITSNSYGSVVQKYFIRSSFLKKTGLIFEEGQIHEDESFTLEILCLADRITSFSETMIYKRLRKDSIMSTKKSLRNVEGWTIAIERVLEFLEKENIDFKTKEAVFIRLRKIAHTAIQTHNNLRSEIPFHRYLPKKTQYELGFLVFLHAMSPFLYRILKSLNRRFRLIKGFR